MNDMLDFSAEFWDNILEYDLLNVDNNSMGNDGSKHKGLTYAAHDYCGTDPCRAVWVQTRREKKRTAVANSGSSGRSKGRTKNQDRQNHLVKN